MASHILITSTSLAEFRPLAWQGVQASSCYDQLVRLLKTKLGDSEASLLAEPITDADGSSVDWYTQKQGSPRRLLDLSPEEQNTVREKLMAYGQAISNISTELKQGSDSNSIMAGSLLEMAISFPGAEHIYVMPDSGGNYTEPVLTAWGFAPGNMATEPENLTRIRPISVAPIAASVPPIVEPEQETLTQPDPTFTPETPIPPETIFASGAVPAANQTEVRHVFPFPWAILAFLAGVLLCIFLLFWLLPKLGLTNSFIGPASCSRQAEPVASTPVAPISEDGRAELYREQGRENALRDELDRLRREYDARLWACDKRAEIADPPPPVEETAPPVPEFTVPQPEPEPEPQPKPQPKPKPKPEPKPEPPKSDNLVIPENPKDLSFLEGCWYAHTGLKSTRTDMPISVKYCFDKHGKGTVSIVERDNKGNQMQECRGSAQAALSGGKLHISDLGAVCPGGITYEQERITCQNADQNQALCTGVGHPSNETNWWDKPFTRTSK